MKIIAHIHTEFSEKFGIPRQSGLVDGLSAQIIFEPKYRNPDALRGMEDFSHLWLIWQFSEAVRPTWSPTVRPPRLGGNKRMGVFATRSPFRPNPIGLSSVKLDKIDFSAKDGPVIYVSGADLMDGTPIYDIKPYLPSADCHPEASGGFTSSNQWHGLKVSISDDMLRLMPEKHRAGLIGTLEQDPRPSYQHDSSRIYGMSFAGYNIQFSVSDDILTVLSITQK